MPKFRYSLFLLLLIPLTVLLAGCDLNDAPALETPTSVAQLPDPTPTNTPSPEPPRPQVDTTPVPEDVLSPIVIQREPRRGERLNPASSIELVFDQPMNKEAVIEAFALQLAGETPETVPGEFTWTSERTLSFQPAESLRRDATYDVVLTQDATASAGAPLRQPYIFRFATAGYLEVAQVIPAPSTADVEADSTITVMFNRPVVPLTSLEQMEDLPQPLSFEPALSGTGEWLNTSIYVFTPDTALAGGTTYTARVSAGLSDIAGAVLAEDFVWQFSTIPPDVVNLRPANEASLVDINTAITVHFNQPIDPASAQEFFQLTRDGLRDTPVEGQLSVDNDPSVNQGPSLEDPYFYEEDIYYDEPMAPGRFGDPGRPAPGIRATLTFTPSESLDYDQRYLINVGAGVRSLNGGEGMREAVSASFTTVPLPEIVSTFPRDGERAASPRTDFRITFNAPIDPDTVMPNLTVTPPFSPAQVYTYFSRYDNTFTVNFGAQASTDYRVEIANGIADPYGNTIPRGRTVAFRTDALPPFYQLHTPEFIATYDASQPAQLFISYVNLNRVNLTLYRLDLEALTAPNWQWRDELPPQAELLREWQVNLEAPLNQREFQAIALSENETNTLAPGIYFVQTSSPDLPNERSYYNSRHILVVSNLNLTFKTAPEQGLIWATDLTSGQPVPNLPLTVYQQEGGQLTTATTDADGVAQFSLPRNHNSLIVATTGDAPFVLASPEWQRGINLWDFGFEGGQMSNQEFQIHLDTDRPLYRPDQTVYFKGVLRADDDASYRLPDVGQVQVTIRNPNWEEVYNESLSLSELATFNGELLLAGDAPLGNYALTVQAQGFYFEKNFQVAAYRPPEFEVLVDPAQSELQRGQDVAATVQTQYFFGGPLAEAQVEWTVYLQNYNFQPAWGGRYSFALVDDPYICLRCWWYSPRQNRETLFSRQGQSDAQGQVALNFTADELTQALSDLGDSAPQGAFQLVVEATVTGPDNQVISGRDTLTVHPGPYYIGLSPQRYVTNAGRPALIDVVAVDWVGERLPDTALTVELYRRAWENVFVETETGGYWENQSEDVFIETATVTTNNLGEAVAEFTPPQAGSYKVIARPANPTAETEAIESSMFIWVAGEENVSWRRDNNDRVTLISDKNSYELGETAEILIPSPFEAPHLALVTVERGQLIQHEVITLESNSHIHRLPITEAHLPNVYVSVVLLKGRTAETLADYKLGLLPLDVGLSSKTLSLSVEAPEQAEPGSEVVYTITATRPDGSPASNAELSLDVVDKAVLSLQPRTADIVSSFYSRRMLEVGTSLGLNVSANRYLQQLAEDLGEDFFEVAAAEAPAEEEARAQSLGAGAMADEAMEEEMMMAAPMPTAMMADADMAAGAANQAQAAGITTREEFADTAFWSPTIRTDANGRASLVVTLPDNLTTWVVRGVGVAGETVVGTETAELVATKPLLVRPVAPRFFVVADRAQLAANISNNTDSEMTVTAELAATGVSLAEATPAQQTLTIPARSERKVTWTATVSDVEQVELIFSALSDDGTFSDASRPRLTTGPDGTLRVFRYTAPDIVGTAGQLIEGGARAEAIALPPEFDERRGSLTVQLDPSLAAGMRDGLAYLEHFEYECTEQTVSRFLPNLLTYNALTSLGIENPELAERLPGLLDEGLKKLYQQQNPDGGWGWWYDPTEYRSNAYVSAYVVFGLLKAQQGQVTVDQAVLENGLAYLQSELMSDYDSNREANLQAWLLYVLAEAQRAPSAQVDDLFTERSLLSHYARAYLAQTIWLTNASDPRLDTLLSDLNNAAILSATGAHWEEDNYDWWAMNTDTRSTAIILDTLTKLDPDNALLPNVVRWLMVARQGGIWETTQETAWSLISLTSWMLETGELEANYEFSLFLNEEERVSGQATRETVDETTEVVIPVAELLADATNALTFARTDGNGRLYYTAHLEVYLPVEEIEPADRGIIVSRRYTLASCEDGPACPEVREAKLGDIIRVDLTLIAPNDLYYVLLEDPLPAGGEAIDTGLATTSLSAMDPTLSRQNSRYGWWWQWYSRSELRDEKVVLFADYLSKGSYEYSYTFRATLPGDYHVIPAVAKEWYFPEVFGRSDGRLLSIGE